MYRLRELGRGRRLLVALAVGGAVFGIATAVQASIPDASGVIHGCYAKAGNPARARCGSWIRGFRASRSRTRSAGTQKESRRYRSDRGDRTDRAERRLELLYRRNRAHNRHRDADWWSRRDPTRYLPHRRPDRRIGTLVRKCRDSMLPDWSGSGSSIAADFFVSTASGGSAPMSGNMTVTTTSNLTAECSEVFPHNGASVFVQGELHAIRVGTLH